MCFQLATTLIDILSNLFNIGILICHHRDINEALGFASRQNTVVLFSPPCKTIIPMITSQLNLSWKRGAGWNTTGQKSNSLNDWRNHGKTMKDLQSTRTHASKSYTKDSQRPCTTTAAREAVRQLGDLPPLRDPRAIRTGPMTSRRLGVCCFGAGIGGVGSMGLTLGFNMPLGATLRNKLNKNRVSSVVLLGTSSELCNHHVLIS